MEGSHKTSNWQLRRRNSSLEIMRHTCTVKKGIALSASHHRTGVNHPYFWCYFLLLIGHFRCWRICPYYAFFCSESVFLAKIATFWTQKFFYTLHSQVLCSCQWGFSGGMQLMLCLCATCAPPPPFQVLRTGLVVLMALGCLTKFYSFHCMASKL